MRSMDNLAREAVRRYLPRQLFLLAGEEASILFDHLCYQPIPGTLLFDVESGPGRHEAQGWRWTAQAPAPLPLKIGYYDGHDLTKRGVETVELQVSDPAALRDVPALRWLAIGDSLTSNGFYLHHVDEILSRLAPGVKLESVGTQRATVEGVTFSHEGRGGWSWDAYLLPGIREERSPFLYGEHFDFDHYLKVSLGGNAPDLITILLGANDVSGACVDFSPGRITKIVSHAQEMVTLIRQAAPGARVALLLPPIPSGQDGFGANYGTAMAAWQYRRALQAYHQEMMRAFDGGEVDLLATHLSLDPDHAYPKEGGRQQNALHPTQEGYRPIAQMVAAWVIHRLLCAAPVA